MKNSLKVLTTLGLAAVFATGASAYRGERLAALGATDTQKQQVRTILRQHQPTAGPLINQLLEERRKLRDTIRAETIDEKAIRAQAAKVAGLEADLAVERARVVHEIKPLLTPEQLKKLKDMQVDADERIDGFLSRVAKRLAAD